MKYLRLSLIGSVQPKMPWTNTTLDKVESRFQKQLMAMEATRNENKRQNKKKRETLKPIAFLFGMSPNIGKVADKSYETPIPG